MDVFPVSAGFLPGHPAVLNFLSKTRPDPETPSKSDATFFNFP